MRASGLRCLVVWGIATAVAIGLVAWLAAVATAPAPRLDGALVRICAALGALAAAWLWAVTTAVALEALHGGEWRAPGVPHAVRRALLAACGVAVAAGLAGPAGAATGHQDPPQTAASVVAAALDGLPLPDRPHGPAHPRPAVVTVRDGDSLWSIAREQLGAGERWPEIYALNRAVVGADPDLIQPAQRLRLPIHRKETR